MAGARSKPRRDYFRDKRYELGKNIRLFREEREYSRDDLAEIMKVSRSTISKIENGKFAMSIDYIMRFGWYLDFDMILVKNKKRSNSR